jgi:hypothetical protein
MKRSIIAVLALALLAAACGGDAEPDETTTTTTTGTPGTTGVPSTTGGPTFGDDSVLLTILDEGGFAPVEFVINRPPTYVLLNDGTLIFQSIEPGAFPGPVMPAMQQVKLTEAQMENVRVLIEATGLPGIDEVNNNDAAAFVADATTTVAVYTDPDGGTHRFAVYALGIQENPSDDIANLALLRDKLAEATFEGAAGEAYVSDRVVVRILQGGGFAEFDDTRPWGFDFRPSDLDDLNGFPCGAFGGDEAAAIKALLADATQATQWEHETGTFTVVARELLPGEIGCDIR